MYPEFLSQIDWLHFLDGYSMGSRDVVWPAFALIVGPFDGADGVAEEELHDREHHLWDESGDHEFAGVEEVVGVEVVVDAAGGEKGGLEIDADEGEDADQTCLEEGGPENGGFDKAVRFRRGTEVHKLSKPHEEKPHHQIQQHNHYPNTLGKQRRSPPSIMLIQVTNLIRFILSAKARIPLLLLNTSIHVSSANHLSDELGPVDLLQYSVLLISEDNLVFNCPFIKSSAIRTWWLFQIIDLDFSLHDPYQQFDIEDG